MNVCKLAIAFGPLLALAPFHSSAYELATHAKITNAAYFQSKLGSPSGVLHRTLGIDVWTYSSTTRVLPFRAGIYDLYADIRGSDIKARNAKDYEGNIIKKAFGESELFKVNGWLMRGVIREDDSSKFVSDNFREPKEPLDDLYGDFNLFCNHFFDPLRPIPDAFPNSRGLTTFCFSESPVFDSPQWALGSLRPFDPAPTEYTTRRNHFSVLDAREAMWRALTLRDRAGSSV